MKKAILIEDDPEVLLYFTKYCKQSALNFSMEKVFSKIRDAAIWLLSNKDIDYIFLSLTLENNRGANIFKQAPIRSKLIIITPENSFIRQVCSQANVPFVVKPIEAKNINQQIEVADNPMSLKPNIPGMVRRLFSHYLPEEKEFLVEAEHKLLTIKLEQVCYFQRFDDHIRVVDLSGNVYTIRRPFEALIADLEEEALFQPHEDYLVANDAVGKHISVDQDFIVLKSPSVRIPLSASGKTNSLEAGIIDSTTQN